MRFLGQLEHSFKPILPLLLSEMTDEHHDIEIGLHDNFEQLQQLLKMLLIEVFAASHCFAVDRQKGLIAATFDFFLEEGQFLQLLAHAVAELPH